MGLAPFKLNSSSFDSTSTSAKNNPNPLNYEILKYHYTGKHLAIIIQYLDCTNYEGKKVLVFENTSLEDLRRQVEIDPHFSENKKMKSPIARYEPTSYGWHLAVKLTKDLL